MSEYAAEMSPSVAAQVLQTPESVPQYFFISRTLTYRVSKRARPLPRWPLIISGILLGGAVALAFYRLFQSIPKETLQDLPEWMVSAEGTAVAQWLEVVGTLGPLSLGGLLLFLWRRWGDVPIPFLRREVWVVSCEEMVESLVDQLTEIQHRYRWTGGRPPALMKPSRGMTIIPLPATSGAVGFDHIALRFDVPMRKGERREIEISQEWVVGSRKPEPRLQHSPSVRTEELFLRVVFLLGSQPTNVEFYVADSRSGTLGTHPEWLSVSHAGVVEKRVVRPDLQTTYGIRWSS